MKKKICVILIAVLVAVLGTSTYFIIDHYKEANKQAELYDELADLVDAAAQTDAATEPTEQIPYSEEKMLLPELAELYQQNGDLVGWISIADTNINYPVMQSVNEPNFYLKHGFDKAYSDYGCPYVQEDCDVQEPSDNLVIYGHHILNKALNNRMLDPSAIFIDGTHIKASANKKKFRKEQAAKAAKVYSGQLRREVNGETRNALYTPPRPGRRYQMGQA